MFFFSNRGKALETIACINCYK